MNYDEARQIGPDGPAPGKWNWSSMNDGINDGAPYTIEPCRKPKPGKERCDHATQEEAERHRWLFELSRMAPMEQPHGPGEDRHKINHDTARELHRCDVPECPNLADYDVQAPFYVNRRQNWLCTKHLNVESIQALHPFVAGMKSIHS